MIKLFELLKEALAVDNYEIEATFPAYESASKNLEQVGVVGGIKIIAVNTKNVSKSLPEWNKYIGSHHWGKNTSYINKNSIWVAQGLNIGNYVKVVNHELIEREMMRALQDRGMTPEESWSIAHPIVKSIGF